eukprot:scaffold1297_cov141-Skeletonema_menzelii.AAC.1
MKNRGGFCRVRVGNGKNARLKGPQLSTKSVDLSSSFLLLKHPAGHPTCHAQLHDALTLTPPSPFTTQDRHEPTLNCTNCAIGGNQITNCEIGYKLNKSETFGIQFRQKHQTLQQELGDDDDDDNDDESMTDILRRDEEKRQLLRNLDLNSCVEVRPSQLDGVGIFANREIPEGTQVFKYNCKPTHKSVDCTPEEVASLLPEAQRMVKKFFLQKEDGCYPVPKHGIACALGLSFLVNSSYSMGSTAKANVRFGDTKDLSGYLEIVTDRKIAPDEELVLSYEFPRSRILPDYVSSSSMVAPSNSKNNGSIDQPPSRQSREGKRNQRIDNSPPRKRQRKSGRESNHGRFSNREAMFWMQPDNVWAPGKVHRYVSAQERNKKCRCEQA